MGEQGDTTQREEDSAVTGPRPRLWLKWVFPARAPIALEHGMVIGRGADCSIAINGVGVSRRHAEIYRQGPLFVLKDLGSTNGSFLGGRRVQHAPLAPGSVLRVGDHVAVLIESAQTPSEFRELASGLFGGHEVQVALEAVRRAATSDIPIVIVGATGTGKERAARAVHELSNRKGAFHAINCAALPAHLAEAELFGYRKGSFTGAERASVGHFRAADRGTLFLDEVVELPSPVQAKLLRAIQEGVVTQLGEQEPISIDVRFVVATQAPLSRAVEARCFREDLRARLEGLVVTLPDLRDRRADLAPLLQHFIRRYSGGRPPLLESKLIEAVCLHHWPQNVRELEFLARHLLAVHGAEPILKRSLLPEAMGVEVREAMTIPPASGEVAERWEHDAQRLALALHRSGGRVAPAAALVGFSRQRAYRLLGGKSPAEFADEHAPVQNGGS